MIIPTPTRAKKLSGHQKENGGTAAAPTTPTAQQQRTMGNQSQNRMGSVKRNLKKGGQNKKNQSQQKNKKQKTVDGTCLFEQNKHCKMCVAHNRKKIQDGLKEMGKPYDEVSIPHRSHDDRCTLNQTTKGGSAETVRVQRVATENLLANNARPATKNIQTIQTGKSHQTGTAASAGSQQTGTAVPTFFVPKKPKPTERKTVGSNKTAAGTINLSDAANLRDKLHESFEAYKAKMDKEAANNECPKDETTKYPKAMGFMASYICGEINHKKPIDTEADLPETPNMSTALSNYRQFFTRVTYIHLPPRHGREPQWRSMS